MKHILKILGFVFLYTQAIKAERQFVIVIPSYNNEAICEKNISSALNQKWPDQALEIVYINDCSTDSTSEKIHSYCKNHPRGHLVKIIDNAVKKGALENLYVVIHSVEPNKVVLTLDGDDLLAHENVIERVDKEYEKGAWLTYGTYTRWPSGNPGYAKEIPNYLHASRLYRLVPGTIVSHLRTFYAGLFHLIKKEDLLFEGKFYQMGWDIPMMYPMVETAGRRAVYIKDVLYLYNENNPISDHKKDRALQLRLDNHARQQQPYQQLETLDFLTR